METQMMAPATSGQRTAGAGKSGGAQQRSDSAGPTVGTSGAAGRTREAAPRTPQPSLQSDVRSFAAGHPHGWNHDEWLGLLEDLRGRGHSVEDHEAIGSLLERERLRLLLQKIRGIGARRIRAIAERYGNLWRLKEADPEEFAREASLPRSLAARVLESIR